MARIKNYELDSTISLNDKLVGTDVDSNNETKNYRISDLLNLAKQSTSQSLGFNRFDDSEYTESSTLNVVDGVTKILYNNGEKYSLIVGDNTFYDTQNNKISPINENDVYTMSVVFKAKCSNTTNGHFQLFIDAPGDYRRIEKSLKFAKGNNEEQNFYETFQFYADSDLVANNVGIQVTSIGAVIDIYDIIFFIQRNQIGL